MKRYLVYKYILAIVCMLQIGSLQAQVNQVVTVNIMPGKLNALIGENKYMIKGLTLKGEINGDDVSVIKDMANLVSINMAGVRIVSGGNYMGHPTISGELPALMFDKKYELESVLLPNSLNAIDSLAFLKCSSLTSIVIPNSVTTIRKHAFLQCTALKSVVMGNNMEFIGDYVFSGCTSLASVTLSKKLISIGQNAFSGCKALTSITLPKSIISLGRYVFSGCPGLTQICCNASTPPTADLLTFSSIDKANCKIYVPKGSSKAYKSAAGWEDLKNIIEESDYVSI